MFLRVYERSIANRRQIDGVVVFLVNPLAQNDSTLSPKATEKKTATLVIQAFDAHRFRSIPREERVHCNGQLGVEVPRIPQDSGMEPEPPLDSQPLTQPYFDPRRQYAEEDGSESEDLADVIVFLHPSSEDALDVVRTTALVSPQHIRYNQSLSHLFEKDIQLSPVQHFEDRDDDASNNGYLGGADGTQPLELPEGVRTDNALALRFSSAVHDYSMGFTFGRNEKDCDILMQPKRRPIKVSNLHFRIFVNDSGVVMLQDCSTNGTWLGNTVLRTNEQYIVQHGAQIEVVTYTDKDNKNYQERATFLVTFPIYEDPKIRDRYRANLEAYLLNRARLAPAKNAAGVRAPYMPRLGRAIASERDTSCGMHWSGAPKYGVQKRLGGGAFATVYLLATRSEGQLFAAKEIQKKNVNTHDLDIKISTEIAIMKKVTHPHVVELVDWMDKGSHLYLIMEYMPYGDLGKFTSRSDPLGEPSAQKVARQVCHALRYIHSLKITHRDIKPDNILVRSWQPLWVKLSDFGLSKMIEEEGGAAAMRTFCGTMLYCAPEVFPDYQKLVNAPPAAATAARYDSKVDIWSLGSVFYQLLLHEPAFHSNKDVAAQAMAAHFVRVLLNTKVDLDPNRQSISHAAADFLQTCLQTDPTERPDARACLEHEWLRFVEDVDTHLPKPLDEDVGAELSKSTQELLELSDAAEDLNSTQLPSEIGSSQLDSGSEIDTAHLEAFLNYRKTSPISDAEVADLPQPTPKKARQVLFGEVAPTGSVDSGIFGRGERPQVNNGFISPEPTDARTDATALHSTVSNVQDLTISSPSSRSTSMAPPPPPMSMPPPAHPSILKRQREEEAPDPVLTTSKRLMAKGSPRTPPDSLFGRLVPVTGSIVEAEELVLRGPVSAWGRHPSLSHRWPRIDDTRIPKTGMDVVFWSQDMAAFTAKRRIDWVNVDLTYQREILDEIILGKVECYLKTRSSLGILVNDVRLNRSADSSWHVIRLRNGDEIEIFNSGKGFLRYKCEFYVGRAREARHKYMPTAVQTCPELQKWSEEMIALNTTKQPALE